MSMPSDLPPPDPSQRNQYEPEPTPARPAEYDRLRRILLGVGGAAMLVFAIGLGAFVLRDDGDDSRPEGATGTAPATAAVVTTAVGTTVAPTTAPATTATTVAPSTSTTVPATTSTTAPPTTTPASTTTAAGPATSSPAGAIRTAQSLMNALAAGRWNEARLLNPGRNESDSTLQSEYGPLVEASIVPAAVTPLGDGRYDMRLGVVAHESEATGHQTSVLCSHWQVDVPDRTVDRISSARLRVETGYIDARTLASELSNVCARFPLR
jgi:hypothetical protein